MKDLSSEAQRLIHLARGADHPDERAVARVERGLATRLALGAGAAGTTTALAASAAGTSAPLAVKALVTLGVTVGLGGGAWLGAEHLHVDATPSALTTSRAIGAQPAPRHAPRSERADPIPLPARPDSTEAELPPDAPAPALEPAPTTARSALGADRARPGGSTPSAAADPTPAADPLHAEAAALRAAQGALRSGDARRALALLDEQDERFQHGSLEEERAAARVLARCQAYGPDAVRGAADRFEQRFPRSALLARVRSACRDRPVPATQESIPRK